MVRSQIPFIRKLLAEMKEDSPQSLEQGFYAEEPNPGCMLESPGKP